MILISCILLCGCKNFFINNFYKRNGIYDEKITLTKLIKTDKEVFFFPMSHLGRELFYQDVNKKIDSLKKEGYYFFYEKVSGSTNDTIVIKKFRKLSGLPYLPNGYKGWTDSILKIKLKKKLVNQPTYKSWGLNSINSMNVDVTLNEMIDFHENKYQVIKLDSCDLKTPITKVTSCKDYHLIKVFKEEVIGDFRNNHVLEELRKSDHKKIAIIYGKNHLPGIQKGLLEQGYSIVKE